MPARTIAERLAEKYLAGFEDDPLLDHPDLKQYAEPNFVGRNGRFYLVRCFKCDSSPRGRENYIPGGASGRCGWGGWKPDVEIVAYIYSKMVLAGEADMNELREMKVQQPPGQPEKRGMDMDELEMHYPAQVGFAKRGVRYVPEYKVLDEDDGYPD